MSISDGAKWREVSKREICPVCERPDWCAVTGPEGNPDAAYCMRTPSELPKGDGWIHRLNDRGLAPSLHQSAPRRKSPTSKAPAQAKPIDNGDESKDANVYPTAEAAVASYAQQLGKPDRQWRYLDAEGETALVVVRWDAKGERKKTIRPISRTAGGWLKTQPPAGRPLYRLPELLASEDTVFVTEGEPAADALVALGLTATTSSGGSAAADKTDWSALAGRDVVIVPDNDEPGAKYTEAVLEILGRLSKPPTVRVVELPGLPPKGDAVDWLAAGRTAEELARDVAATAPAELPTTERPHTWKPFPADVLPACLRDYVVDVARVVQVDPSMAALPGLVVAASAIGGSRVVALGDDWQEPSILWGACVADSGDGKTPAAKPMLAPARAADAALQPENAEREAAYEDAKRIHAADLEAWKKDRKKGSSEPPPRAPDPPAVMRRVVCDVTPEALSPVLQDNQRVLVDRDELSGMLGGMGRYSDGKGAAERAAYLSMHSGEPIRIDRKTGDRRRVYVEAPCLSIYGGVQPALLHSVISGDDVAAGLPARFLWAMPPTRRQRYRKDRVRPEKRDAYEKAVAALYRLDPAIGEFGETLPVVVVLSVEAETIFGECVDRLNDRRADATGPIKGALSKLRAACGRLALVLHCLSEADGDLPIGDELTIDADTMRAAVALTEWFAGEAERVFSMRGESPQEAATRDLVRWIEGRGGVVTERDLSRGPREYRGTGVAGTALQRLVEAGYGTWTVVSTATNQKREFRLATVATATHSPATGGRAESVTVATVSVPESAVDDDGWEAA